MCQPCNGRVVDDFSLHSLNCGLGSSYLGSWLSLWLSRAFEIIRGLRWGRLLVARPRGTLICKLWHWDRCECLFHLEKLWHGAVHSLRCTRYWPDFGLASVFRKIDKHLHLLDRMMNPELNSIISGQDLRLLASSSLKLVGSFLGLKAGPKGEATKTKWHVLFPIFSHFFPPVTLNNSMPYTLQNCHSG